MPDFSKLMKREAGKAPKPKALPAGDDYSGIVKSFELIDATGKGKDYETIIRFHVGLMDWGSQVSEDDKVQDQGDGTVKAVDLAKRQLRRDFYDNSMHRLDDLLRSCEIEPAGRTYEECIPEMVGKRVTVQVQQYLNQSTNEIGNQIGNLAGAK